MAAPLSTLIVERIESSEVMSKSVMKLIDIGMASLPVERELFGVRNAMVADIIAGSLAEALRGGIGDGLSKVVRNEGVMVRALVDSAITDEVAREVTGLLIARHYGGDK